MKNKMIIATVALAGASTLPQMAMASEYEDLQQEISTLKSEMQKLQAKQNTGTVKSHSRKTSFEISGQVNRALQFVDDGSDTYLNSVDNDNSSTRLRAIVEAEVSKELVVGGAIEVQLESNSTAKVNQLNEESGDGTQSFTDRRAEVYLDHDRYGKLWLGQGWTASDGTSENDLSGTSVASGSYNGGAAGVLFRNADGSLDSTALGKLTSNLDGLGRNDRIRYDTPSLGGFALATSAVQGGAWDLAARYGYKDSNMKVKAALAFADQSSKASSDVDNQVNGSVAVLLNNGWNGMVSYGTQDLKAGSSRAAANADPSHFYTKLGYQTSLNNLGKTAFSVDYRLSEAQQQAGEEVEGYGVQVVQKVQQYGTEVFFSLNQFERSAQGKDYDDVTVALVGARVKF